MVSEVGLHAIFLELGIPFVLRSDNGPLLCIRRFQGIPARMQSCPLHIISTILLRDNVKP